MKNYKVTFQGVIFDDVVVNYDDGVKLWSQICQSCADGHNIDSKYLDEAGQGTCGVEGCENEADYYIDFPDNITR